MFAVLEVLFGGNNNLEFLATRTGRRQFFPTIYDILRPLSGFGRGSFF
jgi:hypothetical protein